MTTRTARAKRPATAPKRADVRAYITAHLGSIGYIAGTHYYIGSIQLTHTGLDRVNLITLEGTRAAVLRDDINGAGRLLATDCGNEVAIPLNNTGYTD